MTGVEALRAAQARMVAENPVLITVHRTTRVEKDGGFEETEADVGPFLVRVYQERSALPVVTTTVAGSKQAMPAWSLAAHHEADLQAGPHVKDEFEAPGLGRFQVLAVYPMQLHGAVWGHKADLEKVS